jgi:murein DD-endopeptidase / murein LD-carboxypeptidase
MKLKYSMKAISSFICLIFIYLALVGCGTAPYKDATTSHNYRSKLDATNDKATVKSKLLAQHQEWRGTPYKMGSMSKRGIDCSGFVYLTYLDQFGIKLPRSTEQQANLGIQISQRDMRTGDLVFFKTGITIKHVGIYLGNRTFLHASTSQGVKISSMDNEYWRDAFWKVQRI